MSNPAVKNEIPIYSKLAYVYDSLMSNVDYETWADYIDEIIERHHPQATRLLEMACGTGSIAISLDELGYYDILATDMSPDMIAKAKSKADESICEVSFRTMNFLNIDLKETFDVVFMVFDSINYLHTKEEILKLHTEVRKVLRPGGYFIFDFTTPRNSRQAIRQLNREEGKSRDKMYHYFRTSSFDARNNIHTNKFEIEKCGEDNRSSTENFVEIHRQKIYTFDQMMRILLKTGYQIEKAYDGFTFEDANNKSLRITVVAQCQKMQ